MGVTPADSNVREASTRSNRGHGDDPNVRQPTTKWNPGNGDDPGHALTCSGSGRRAGKLLRMVPIL